MNSALNPVVREQAIARILGALAMPEAPDKLRTLAIDLASEGIDRTDLLDLFRQAYANRAEGGYDEEATMVADVLDMIETWFDRGKATF